MSKIFDKVSVKTPQASTFDMTHDVKLSTKMGKLTPVLAIDVLPGDKFKIGADALIKFAPILAPLMHMINLYIHYFFVPNRLLWSNWENFITGTPDDLGDPYIPPYITNFYANNSDSLEFNKLCDYIGITPAVDGDPGSEAISALPLAAYNLIYNEYYRDQNLIDPLFFELVDGDNTANKASFKLRNRAWEHDYFTSCLPFAQKGAAVDLPLGNVELVDDWKTIGSPTARDENGNEISGNAEFLSATGTPFASGGVEVAYDPMGTLQVGATTINDLRRAYALQEWLEKNARGGTRYTEAIRMHFAVKSPDARLQRPEYITGVKSPVIISEVLNTTGPLAYWNGSEPVEMGGSQGQMTGHGTAIAQGNIGHYYAQEHGWIIGIMSVTPKTAYQQGINKMFTRNTYLDYAFPSFAHLGEQEVYTKEIYAYKDVSDNLFGYIPRYAEYKFMNSRVAGDFRTTLNYWHLGRIFSNEPTLNQSFIECIPDDVSRIFAVEDGTDNLWCHVLNKLKVYRKLPFFGTPSI